MNLFKKTGQGALIAALLVLAGCSQIPGEFSILFGGDIMLARAGETLYNSPGTGETPWGDILDFTDNTKGTFFAANLESPVGIADVSGQDMNLCAPVEIAGLLQQAGLDLLTGANNHALDCEENGVTSTSEVLEQAGIHYITSSTTAKNLIISGKEVAFFAVEGYSGEVQPELLFNEIRQAAREGRIVIVSIHWGNEYQAGPDEQQERLARALVEAGADVIWGHHPHVLQRMEWIRSDVDGHQALVMYSIGNLLSDQWMLPDALRTALVRLTFREEEITRVEVIPLIMDHRSGMLLVRGEDDNREVIARRLNLDSLKDEGGNAKVSLINHP